MEKNDKKTISDIRSEAGRKGGLVKSEKKAAVVAENGKKGGRPSYDDKYRAVFKELDEKYGDIMADIAAAQETVKKQYGHIIRDRHTFAPFWIRELKKTYTEKDFHRFDAFSDLVFRAFKYGKTHYEPEDVALWVRYDIMAVDARIFVGCYGNSSYEEGCYSDNTKFVMNLITEAFLCDSKDRKNPDFRNVTDKDEFIKRFWERAASDKPWEDEEINWSTIGPPNIVGELKELATGKYNEYYGGFFNRELGNLSEMATILLESAKERGN
jgi:hypothetical protein